MGTTEKTVQTPNPVFVLFAKFCQTLKYIARNWQLQEYFLHASQQEINSNANYQSK